MKIKRRLLSLLLLPILSMTLHSAVIIDLSQNGADLVVSGTGTIDLSSTTSLSFSGVGSVQGFNLTVDTNTYIGLSSSSRDIYTLANLSITGPSSTGSPFLSNIGSANEGVFVNSLSGGNLFVPAGYVSGNALDFSIVLSNYSFSDYGFSDGDTIVASWSDGVTNESLTLNFQTIPEPSSGILAMISLGGLLIRRNR